MPGEVHIRPPQPGDAEAVTALVVAVDVDEYGAPDFELDDLRSEWASPGLDLERDAWLAELPDGWLAAYALIRYDDSADVFVHPAHRMLGIGSELRALVEGRALERAEPGEQVVVAQILSSVNAPGRALLESAGYEPVQAYWRMVLPLEGELPEPRWPAGVTVRTFDPSRDARAVHAVIADAFADNERRQPFEPFEEWEAREVGRSALDPTLWFLAEADGKLVGAIVCPNYESEGWVRQLAVARRWRRRGIGTALLLQAFAEFRRRGRPHAALVVDSWNRTGARAVYEEIGMRVEREHTRFQKELRAGA